MIVLVTAGNRASIETTQPNSEGRVRPKPGEVWISDPYLAAIRAAGGTPLIVVPEEKNIDQLIEIKENLIALNIKPNNKAALFNQGYY